MFVIADKWQITAGFFNTGGESTADVTLIMQCKCLERCDRRWVDTGGEFAAGVNVTGGRFATCNHGAEVAP